MANGLFGGGNGTLETPFLVEDAQDLNAVRNDMTKQYKQTTNIDLAGYTNWVPIGTLAAPFIGLYDGNQLTISNLNILSTIQYSGLFGYVTGDIKKVNIVSGSLSSSMTYAGAICGWSVKPVTFCSNQGCSVTKTGSQEYTQDYFGGICGKGPVEDSFNMANLTSGGTFVGGVVGSGSCIRCYNTGSVITSGYEVAGVICDGPATECYNTGVVSTSSSYGAAAGITCEGDTFKCYNTAAISGTYVYGVSRIGTATRCYNTGNLTATFTCAGVSEERAIDCYNTGALSARDERVFGISIIEATRCVNTGNLTGFSGGYGITMGIAKNCYGLNATITRLANSSEDKQWAKVTTDSSLASVGNYGLDTMVMVYL